MSNEDKLLKEIGALLKQGGDKKVSGLGIAASPELAAVISKLQRPVNKEDEQLMDGGNMRATMLTGANNISKQQMGRKENSYNAFKLFPDLELAAQIVITSVLSPKDMLTSKLNYRLDESPLPVAATSEILDIIRSEMVQTYKLDESLYDILHEALFASGSYPFIVLPESAVDAVINEPHVLATEAAHNSGLFTGGDLSKVRNVGILGDPHVELSTRPALESIFTRHAPSLTYNEALYVHADFEKITDDEIEIKKLIGIAKDTVTVTDNYDIARLPELVEAVTAEKMSKLVRNPLRVAMESADPKITPERLFEMIYKQTPSKYAPYSSIPTSLQLKRRSVGRPAVLKPGAEALIPIFLPGEYDNHIAYFLVVDVDGHPVTLDSTVNEHGQGFSGTGQSERSGAGASNLLTDRAKKNLVSDNWTPQIAKMAEFYSQIVEKDLLERLSRGVMGNKSVEIKISSELSRTMLARSWRGQNTRIVFVPGEYVTYFAYDYHRNGVGKSYLDDLSNVVGLRAMVLFSSVWARVRSSISTIDTHLVLDPRDTDPVKTIELTKHLIARSRQQYFPNGLQSVQDFTDWLHNAGIRVTWEGHPSLPATTVTSESKNIDHVQPDDTLAEQLADMCYTRFGVTKEMVDGASTSDFAATVENHSVLFNRRTMVLGQATTKHATNLVQKLVTFDETIQKQLVQVLNTHQESILRDLSEEDKAVFEANFVVFTKMMLADIISRIRAELPEPDAAKMISTKEKVEAYAEMLDLVLEYIFSDKFMTREIAGDLSDSVGPLKEAWKAEVMRRYITNNDILPEVFDIISLDADGKPMIRLNELVGDHIQKIMLSSVDLLSKIKKSREASDKDLAVLTDGAGLTGDDSSSTDASTGSPDDEFSSSGDDDVLGGMGDEELPLDDTPGSDEPAATDEPDPDADKDDKKPDPAEDKKEPEA